jgi:hypothetical protein
MAGLVSIQLDVPEEVSAEVRELAAQHAHETAVLVLWQAGEISTRTAAAELGITYYDFLDMLAEKGIPVEGAIYHLREAEAARQKRKQAQAPVP